MSILLPGPRSQSRAVGSAHVRVRAQSHRRALLGGAPATKEAKEGAKGPRYRARLLAGNAAENDADTLARAMQHDDGDVASLLASLDLTQYDIHAHEDECTNRNASTRE